MILSKLGICVALGVAALSNAAQAQDAAAIPVEVDGARLEAVSEAVAVIGRFVSRQAGVVAAQAEGAVANVLVEVGDRVEAGAPLVELDIRRIALNSDLWQAELAAAKAALAEAEAVRLMEEQALSRLSDLTESAAFSQARFDDQTQKLAASVASVARARAEVLWTEANLSLAQDALEKATIRAPYDGVVVLRHTEIGSWLDIGDNVVTMVNDAFIEIEADVPVDRLGSLGEGTVVAVTMADGARQEAFVRAVGISEDSQARTRPVRFTPAWEVASGERANGESATVLIPVGTEGQAVTVSKDAVVRRGGVPGVFVVEGGFARFRVVELGPAVGNRVVVLRGLSDGEAVIVRGNEELDATTATAVSATGAS
jgi:RND family efflux transporter MFP subunit